MSGRGSNRHKSQSHRDSTSAAGGRSLRSYYLLLTLALLGIVGVVVAQVYFYLAQRQARGLWGDATTWMFVHASRVEVAKLEPIDLSQPRQANREGTIRTLFIQGKAMHEIEHRDVTHHPAIDNLRDALLYGTSYEWPADGADKMAKLPDDVKWQYSLTFENDAHEQTLLVSAQGRALMLLDSGTTAILTPKLAAGLARFLSEQF
jgi:hypothetical protein